MILVDVGRRSRDDRRGASAGRAAHKKSTSSRLEGSMKRILKHAMLAASLSVWAGAADANTLRFAESQEIASMDPHAARDDFALSLIGNVYEGLVRWNKELKLEPALAESWEA